MPAKASFITLHHTHITLTSRSHHYTTGANPPLTNHIVETLAREPFDGSRRAYSAELRSIQPPSYINLFKGSYIYDRVDSFYSILHTHPSLPRTIAARAASHMCSASDFANRHRLHFAKCKFAK